MNSPFTDFIQSEEPGMDNYVPKNDSFDQFMPFNIDWAGIGDAIGKATTPSITSEGVTSWAKEALGFVSGVQLSNNDMLDEATKLAIIDFQKLNSIPETGKIDYITERTLLEATALRKAKGTAKESVIVNMIALAKHQIEDWTKQGDAGRKQRDEIPALVTTTFRDPRRLFAFVLHHMAAKHWNKITKKHCDPALYMKVGAHFYIMFDGRIIQAHPVSRLIFHAQKLSYLSVSVEFEGNFPNDRYGWWPKDAKPDRKDFPTRSQFESGQFLAKYLQIILGTRSIYAHRQSSENRADDPGPDIWFKVGQWAINNLGMSDGGDTFKLGTGKPIPASWRTWGDKTDVHFNRTITPEYVENEQYDEVEVYEQPEEEIDYEEHQDHEDYEDYESAEQQNNEAYNLEESIYETESNSETGEEDYSMYPSENNETDLKNAEDPDPSQPVILARGVSANGKRTFYKMYDKVNKKFIGESYDDQGNKITQTNEDEVLADLNNKIHPALQMQILKAADTDPIDIAVWMNIDVKEPLKSNYQPVQLVTMPPEIADHRRKLAVTIADTARKVTIERSGIQVQRVSDLLPLFFAKATKRTIDLVKNDPLVLGIFFNDRSYFESLSTSLSRSGAAEAQTAGMTSLGKDIKVAVWENAPDLLTNLTIEGYYDPATPNVSDHARLVSAIIKNKEPGKSKGYAPNCKLYSANLSGSDLLAPLEWAAKQGCTVINRSFHQNTDQVNAGMQLSDFVTDALALRYPYPMIVQASGNTGQPDDTALGITPPGNEYVNHKGYNSIAVGSHDEHTERKISTFSTFRNPSSPKGDRELPEICALGENITAVGLVDWGGTSFSSPAVAGSAALLQSISPVLKLYPEVIRTLLMAGAKRNVDGGFWFQDLKRTPKVDQKDGTGALNIYESITIAKKPYQPKKVALDKGWDYGILNASSFGPDKKSIREWKITVPQTRKHVKISLAWNSNANYAEIWGFRFLKDTTLDMDLDIMVYDDTDTLVATSSSFDNSFEIVDYMAQGLKTLTVKINGYSVKPSAWTYFGIAWTTF